MPKKQQHRLVKKKTGRPTVITPEVVSKLEEVFKLGVTDTMACQYAGISRKPFYARLKSDEVFRNKMDTAKNFDRIAAGSVVMNSIVKKKNTTDAKWWLEKKYGSEFSGNKEGTNVNIGQIGGAMKIEFIAEETNESKTAPETIRDSTGQDSI